MKYLIDQGKKTLSVLGLFLFWFVLCGVKRGPGADASDLSTSDLAATNILKSMPPISTWPLSFWITLFFMMNAAFVMVLVLSMNVAVLIYLKVTVTAMVM